jgi:hypothetical protein
MTRELTHKEMSSRGGKANVYKYGKEKFIEMRKKGVEAAKARYGDKTYKQVMYLKQLDTKLERCLITYDKYMMFKEATLKKIEAIKNSPDK